MYVHMYIYNTFGDYKIINIDKIEKDKDQAITGNIYVHMFKKCLQN